MGEIYVCVGKKHNRWAELVVGSRPCSEGFSPDLLLPQKPTFPISIWNQQTKSHSVEVPLQIQIYLFIYFIYRCSTLHMSHKILHGLKEKMELSRLQSNYVAIQSFLENEDYWLGG